MSGDAVSWNSCSRPRKAVRELILELDLRRRSRSRQEGRQHSNLPTLPTFVMSYRA
jgi:hypothetical protein